MGLTILIIFFIPHTPASLETPPPIIRYGPSDQTRIAETLAILTCQTEGSPSPRVSWTKDGSPIAMETGLVVVGLVVIFLSYNLINNFSINACGARRARSCATAYQLTGAQHTLRAGIVRDDRELFHQIIANFRVMSPGWCVLSTFQSRQFSS